VGGRPRTRPHAGSAQLLHRALRGMSLRHPLRVVLRT
jgi:hypothetical protein